LAAAWPLSVVYPSSFFRLILLIVLSLLAGKIRHTFHKCCDRYFRYTLCYLVKELLRFEIIYVEECMHVCMYGMPMSESDYCIPEE
jgi:hypothetical protein